MLCERCTYMKPIVSGKGAVFFQCLKYCEDASYSKYPRMPVLHCLGFSAIDPLAP